MENAKRFEDLWIWQQARALVRDVYSDFRSARDYGFKDQVQRAGVSVMNNIAEGFERRTNSEFARFLDIAKGSCGEVRSLYYAGEDLGYVDGDTASARRVVAMKIAAGIASLAKRARKNDAETL